MTIHTYPIDTYKVSHYSKDSRSTYMIINLYEGTTQRGAIIFLKEGRGSAPSSHADGRVRIVMEERQASEILETLRVETPLHIWFNDVNNVGIIGTDREFIGEEEG
jgi:hypothetical protein